MRIIYNRFQSAISFKPTIATVLRCAATYSLLLGVFLLCPVNGNSRSCM